MAAKGVEGEACSERAVLKQQVAASFPLDVLLPALHVGNVLSNFEFAQLLPTPRSTLADRNHRLLEYLDKNPSAASLTLSILTHPEHLFYRHFGEMLHELFGVETQDGESLGTLGIASIQPVQRRGCVSGAREVSTLWPPNTRVVQCSANGLVLSEL